MKCTHCNKDVPKQSEEAEKEIQEKGLRGFCNTFCLENFKKNVMIDFRIKQLKARK